MKHRYTKCHRKLISVLSEARVEAGLSQRQLCDKLKRGKNFVSVVELGERSLSVCEFIDYAKAVGVPPAKLFACLLD